jgi:hypothetical protein
MLYIDKLRMKLVRVDAPESELSIDSNYRAGE